MSEFGIDYSYGNGLTTDQMKAAGVRFACRYLAYLPNGKVINKTELGNLLKAGIHVVFVWEQSGRDCDRGYVGGQQDAREAKRQLGLLGVPGAVVYFAPVDYDAPPGDQAKINNYMSGAIAEMTLPKTGFYGGYWTCLRTAQARKAAFFWQTYAWSGVNLPGNQGDAGGFTRHLFQYRNGMRMGPAEVDFDTALSTDYGQWPRPTTAPAPLPAGPYRHVIQTGNTLDIFELARTRNITVEKLVEISRPSLSAKNAAIMDAVLALDTALMAANLPRVTLPPGFVYWTVNP